MKSATTAPVRLMTSGIIRPARETFVSPAKFLQ